jgi:hypothetical protein
LTASVGVEALRQRDGKPFTASTTAQHSVLKGFVITCCSFFGTAKIPRGLHVTVFRYFKGTRTMFDGKGSNHLYYSKKRARGHFEKFVFFRTQGHCYLHFLACRGRWVAAIMRKLRTQVEQKSTEQG